jgi:hypothetical protein
LSQSPAAVYADRLAARRATAAHLRTRLDSLSGIRLAVFLAGVVVAGLAVGGVLSPYFVLAPVVVFAVLVARYEGVKLRIAWAERGAQVYSNGLARLDGKPTGAHDGARFADDSHPYAADLDLFGPGSLFALLNAARTRGGEDTLAAWLKSGASPEEVSARQTAVADLTPRLDLREALAVAGSDVPPADYASLAKWGTEDIPAPPTWKRWAVEVLGWGNVAAWFGWLFAGTTSLPVIAFGLPSLILALPLMRWSRRVLAPVEKAERELSLLDSLLARLEGEPVTSPRMKSLQAAMSADGKSAAAQIRELRTLVGWFNSRRNALFIPVAFLRMWDTRYAFKLEEWRARSGRAIGPWLTAIGEAEALSSLAGFAFENPADVFPTVEPGPARFAAVCIGHPLLPAGKCVRNDVRFGDSPRLLVISGSNMSGKSTLLRSVGVNAVLALAGGVVRAASLSLTPVALGATMRVQDSLQAGRSRFFAEVAKVRALLDIATANAPPLLFLLDELFSGTNSADRVAGAEGVIRTLLDAGAVGLVTTHDLALTDVTARLPGAVNVHFCDGFAGGELNFDYTMRPGVVPHGNGLALMRAVGLKV